MSYRALSQQANSIKMFFVSAALQITLIKMPHKYALINQSKQSSLKQSGLTLFD